MGKLTFKFTVEITLLEQEEKMERKWCMEEEAKNQKRKRFVHHVESHG